MANSKTAKSAGRTVDERLSKYAVSSNYTGNTNAIKVSDSVRKAENAKINSSKSSTTSNSGGSSSSELIPTLEDNSGSSDDSKDTSEEHRNSSDDIEKESEEKKKKNKKQEEDYLAESRKRQEEQRKKEREARENAIKQKEAQNAQNKSSMKDVSVIGVAGDNTIPTLNEDSLLMKAYNVSPAKKVTELGVNSVLNKLQKNAEKENEKTEKANKLLNNLDGKTVNKYGLSNNYDDYANDPNVSDEELVKEYESIPEYNLLERTFDKDKKEAYTKKSALSQRYNDIKTKETVQKLEDSGISLDEVLDWQDKMYGVSSSDEDATNAYKKEQALLDSGLVSRDDYNRLVTSLQNEKTSQTKSEDAFADSVASIATKPAENSFNIVENAANYVTGKPMRSSLNSSDARRSAILDKNIGAENKFGQMLYSQGMSGADNIVAMLSNIIMPGSGSTTMGIEKASEVLNSSIDRGLNPVQTVSNAILSGVSTAITEGKSMDYIMDNVVGGAGGNILKSMLAEGTQEVAESLLDTLSDFAVNVGGGSVNKTEILNEYNYYKQNGASDQDAAWNTFVNYAKGLANDFVGGSVMGGVMSGINNTLNFMAGNRNRNVYSELLENSENTENTNNANNIPAIDNSTDNLVNVENAENVENVEVPNTLENAKVEKTVIPPEVQSEMNALLPSSEYAKNYETAIRKYYETGNLSNIAVAERLAGEKGDSDIKMMLAEMITEATSDENSPYAQYSEDRFVPNEYDVVPNDVSDENDTWINMDVEEELPTLVEYLDESENTDLKEDEQIIYQFIPGNPYSKTANETINRLAYEYMMNNNAEQSVPSIENNTNGETSNEQNVGSSNEYVSSFPASFTGDIIEDYNNDFGIKGGSQKVSDFRENKFEDNLSPKVIADTFHKKNDFIFDSHTNEESYDAGHDFATRASDEQIESLVKKAFEKDSDGNASALKQWQIDALMDLATTAEREGYETNNINKLNYANRLYRAVQKQATNNAQAMQALVKWKKSTSEGKVQDAKTKLLTVAESIVGKKNTEHTENVINTVTDIVDSSTNEDGSLSYEEMIRKIMEEQKSLGGENWENTIRNIIEESNKGTISRDTVIDILERDGRVNKQIAELMKDDVETQKKVIELVEEASKLDRNDYQARLLVARAGKLIAKKMPTGFFARGREIAYHNMLSSPRTVLARNAGGNLGVNVIEQLVTKNLETGIDKLTSLKTGKRTSTVNKESLPSYAKGFATGFLDEMRDVGNSFSEYFKNKSGTGIHTGKVGDLDLADAVYRNATKIKGDNIPGKIFNFANDIIVKHGMSLGDRVFYEGRKSEALNDFDHLIKNNFDIGAYGMDIDSFVEAAATEVALESVYQNDSNMSEGFQKVAEALEKISKGLVGADFLTQAYTRFIKTPANVIQTNLDYTPIGLAKNAIETSLEIAKDISGKTYGTPNQNFDQRRFVNELSRSIVGTALMAICVALYESGFISGGYSDDKDEKAMQKANGEQEYALKLGDKQIDLSWMPVIGTSLEAGAAGAEAYDESRKDGKGFIPSMANSLSAGTKQVINTQFDQSMIGTLKDALGGNPFTNGDSIGERLYNSTLNAYTSQLIPAWIKQLAQSTDKYQRELGKYGTSEYALRTIANNIPGLREAVNDVKYDNYGNPLEQNQGRNVASKLFENMFLPGKYTEVKEDVISDEAKRLLDSTKKNSAFVPTADRNDIKDADGKSATTATFNEYKRTLGEYNSTVFNEAYNNEFYSSASDIAKVDTLGTLYSDVKALVKQDFVGYNAEDSIGKNAYESYLEYGLNGLATYTLLNNMKSKDETDVVSAICNSNLPEDQKDFFVDKFGKKSEKKLYELTKTPISTTTYDETVQIQDKIKDAKDKNIENGGTGYLGGADIIEVLSDTELTDEQLADYILSNVDYLTKGAEEVGKDSKENITMYYRIKDMLDTDGNGRLKKEEKSDDKLIPVLENLGMGDSEINYWKNVSW